MLKRFIRPFRQLRGKLTLSYTLAAVVTFLFVEVLVISLVITFASLNISRNVVATLAVAR